MAPEPQDDTIEPVYRDDNTTLYLGDSLEILPTLASDSVDAICTDPPYELKFMGKTWDGAGTAYNVDLWRECLRVLKPGGHMVAFGGTRTYHRLACAIEDAGFEIRDSLHWIYGSGFPKSLDVSKAIDKAAGAQRERVPLVGGALNSGTANGWNGSSPHSATAPLAGTRQVDTAATDEAARWKGWGTALKPAHEPIVLARKPLTGTVAGNVLAHGTGALNIDATRIGNEVRTNNPGSASSLHRVSRVEQGYRKNLFAQSAREMSEVTGRWPTNVVFSHPPILDERGEPVGDACADGCVKGCPVAEMDAQSGNRRGFASQTDLRTTDSNYFGADKHPGVRQGYDDQGGASRFFPVFRYQAKAPSKERPKVNGVAHPTVKPLPLMQWLVRLITPPGGTVLDLFAGSGTTLEAAALEGVFSIGIEGEATYIPLCLARFDRVRKAA